MHSIYHLVHQTLKAGYLSMDTEAQIRNLFDTRLNSYDIEALMLLQQAIENGRVKRQAHEIYEAGKKKSNKLQIA
jgi:DNA-dependent RNA polymerase auxiliary subunit epsilon